MHKINNIIGIIAACIVWAWVGYQIGRARQYAIDEASIRNGVSVTELPSIQEIQKKVNVKPDGRLGLATQKAWDRAICDQYDRQIKIQISNSKIAKAYK